MKATEFAYWLQGYFEIGGGELSSQEQLNLIFQKLRQVKRDGQEPSEKKAAEFANNLVYVIMPAPGAQNPVDIAKASATLKQQLHDLFVHAIDPSYQGDQGKFNDLHGGGFPPREPGMRC